VNRPRRRRAPTSTIERPAQTESFAPRRAPREGSIDLPRFAETEPPAIDDRYILVALAMVKVAVLVVIGFAYNLLPFFAANFRSNFVDPAHADVSLATAYSTWDAQHYLYLSESGYHPGQMSDAFFPLFPFLIHVFTPLFQSSLVAGLAIANLASLAGLYLLFKLIGRLYGGETAGGTILLYLAFPTAFFFSEIYTESVFLLLVAAFFTLLFQQRLGWAAVAAMLLPLARPEGSLIIIPFAVYYLFEVLDVRDGGLGAALSRIRLPELACVCSPIAGGLAYLAFMRAATGNAFEMLNAMQGYVSAHSLSYLLHPVELAQALGEWPLALHGFTNSAIDRLVFVGFLLLLVPLFRRVHPALAVYALVVGILNVVSGTFMSYSRYVLLAFPVFIAAAMLLQKPNLRFLRLPIAFSFTLIQGLFLVMHSLSYWVA
jgi:hypothetical protein